MHGEIGIKMDKDSNFTDRTQSESVPEEAVAIGGEPGAAEGGAAGGGSEAGLDADEAEQLRPIGEGVVRGAAGAAGAGVSELVPAGRPVAADDRGGAGAEEGVGGEQNAGGADDEAEGGEPAGGGGDGGRAGDAGQPRPSGLLGLGVVAGDGEDPRRWHFGKCGGQGVDSEVKDLRGDLLGVREGGLSLKQPTGQTGWPTRSRGHQ